MRSFTPSSVTWSFYSQNRITSFLIVTAVLCGLAVCTSAHPESARKSTKSYFRSTTVNDFEQQWFSSDLSTMKEPVLSAAGKPAGYFALRILLIPTWDRPVAVRYETDGTHGRYRAVMLSGQGGYDPGKIKMEKTAHLSKSEIASLSSSLDQSGYWSLPANDEVIGTDGSELIVETIRNGEHRVLVRWTPESDAHGRGLENIIAFYHSELTKAGLWPRVHD